MSEIDWDEYEDKNFIRTEDGSTTTIDDLILDLSLSSAFPVGVGGTNLFKATASMQALAYRTAKMEKHELKELEYVMGPLLGLLVSDLNHPIAAKSAFAIRTLIASRKCLNRFVECDGIHLLGTVLDQLLVSGVDLNVLCDERTIVENMAIIYREGARYFDKEIVVVGALRHCVRMVTYGDPTIRGIAASTLAILSNNPDIVLQMFSYGAIAPILKISGLDSSEPEMLAGLGCLVQLVRIPQIAIRVVGQGAVSILEGALHLMHSRTPGVANSVRSKALLSFAWLSKVPQVRHLISGPNVFRGMERELLNGKPNDQTMVLQMMINFRLNHSEHQNKYKKVVFDKVLFLMKDGLWFSRNLTTKCLCLIYITPDEKIYAAQNGALESIFNLIESKSLDLQEIPLVALLSFCTHPEIPFIILEKGYHMILIDVLYAINETIRELAVVILKALKLYAAEKITACIPADKEFLMRADPDKDPVVYGSEYGGNIQGYLGYIIENRREMKYLLEDFDKATIEKENITDEELESFQATFMLLDYDCNGTLALDEIKVLMVLMGEKLDAEEIQLLFDEYDEDNSGELCFSEFCTMMKNWKTRFGSGATKVYNEAFKRGAIGKGKRAFDRWWNKDELQAKEVAEVKRKKAEEIAKKQAEMEKHMGAEKLRVQRELEKKMREQRTKESLPSI
jgi:hypothetical protein